MLLKLIEDHHELIIKEFLGIAIGSICLFSLVGLPLCLSVLATISAVRALAFLSKLATKLAITAILKTFQAFVRSLSDVNLRPFVTTMAVSLKFRTHQLCRTVWIGIAFLFDPPQDEEIVDPTVYVYDPRGRSFQSFDPNWKPCLGAFRRKMAKKRHCAKDGGTCSSDCFLRHRSLPSSVSTQKFKGRQTAETYQNTDRRNHEARRFI